MRGLGTSLTSLACMIMPENVPIMLALCSMLARPYYAPNYAGIIRPSLTASNKSWAEAWERGYIHKSLPAFRLAFNYAVSVQTRLLSSKPHIGGGDRNKMLTDLIYQQWKEYEFDEVELKKYSVLLSYPNESNPNVLELRDRGGTVLYSARTAQEPPLTPGENDSTVASPFNAYAGVGSASVRCLCSS